jgi:hypothetical protein
MWRNRAIALLPDLLHAGHGDDEVPLGWADLRAKKRRCRSCREPLWQADRTGPHRFPLADYIHRRMPGHFDLLIADKLHEYKARGSAQGLAAGVLAEACGKTLTLTRTALGGYSSTLFYLLWRFSPAVRREFGYHAEQSGSAGMALSSGSPRRIPMPIPTTAGSPSAGAISPAPSRSRVFRRRCSST